jgi:starch synthase
VKVAYVTPEMQPFAKTGGLGDVANALTQALAQHGTDVCVYLPAYTSVLEWCKAHGLKPRHVELPYPMQILDAAYPLVYGEVRWGGVQLVLVGNDAFYARPHPYLTAEKLDYPDNLARYAFFCRAVAEHLIVRGGGCDILHLNDWQTALLAAYLPQQYSVRLPRPPRTVLTIHNLGYQGVFPVDDFPATGLDWRHYNADEFEFYGRVDLLKGGLVHADALTTVSPTYAEEIQTAEYGHGLDGVLRGQRAKLTGILNGIDPAEWNPESDPHLYAHYGAADLAGKARCKADLQRRLGLPLRPRSLLLGCISRFDRQKGIQLLLDAFPDLSALDLQLAVLGSGSHELEEAARRLALRYPEQVAVEVGFDEPLAHLIEAGSDLFAMPSRYEPCGLNQMYSQRYGTIPVVRATGGLRDTVADYSAGAAASGFVFSDPTPAALAATVHRAAQLYFTNRRRFNALARQVMQLDHSWSSRAGQYLQLYTDLSAAPLRQQEAADA